MEGVSNASVVDFEGNSSYNSNFVNPFSVAYVRLVFIITYAGVCGVCVIGNTLVLFAVARSPRLRSMTNFFLANLAVADLCVGVFCVLPNLSTYLSPTWILGRAMCKIYYYVWNVSYTASILILTIIAVERYIAIIHPLQVRHFLTRRKLITIQMINWVIAIAYNIPYLVFYDTVELLSFNVVFCYFDSESITGLKGLSIANLIVWYIIPLSMIAVIYYKIGKALWKTAIVSGIRFKSSSNKCSVGSFSTRSHRMSPVNTGSLKQPAETPEDTNKCPPKTIDIQDSGIKQEQKDDFNKERVSLKFSFDEKHITKSPEDVHCFINTVARNNNVENHCPNSPTDSNVFGDTFSSETSKKSSLLCRASQGSRRVAKARKEVVRLLTAIVIAFSICVLPHHLKVLNHYWNIFAFPHRVEVYISPCSHVILYLNSALNPVLYALLSKNFRKSLKETLPCFRNRPKQLSSPRRFRSRY